MTPIEHLQQRAKDLPLYGLLAHWHELADRARIESLLTWPIFVTSTNNYLLFQQVTIFNLSQMALQIFSYR